MSEIVNVLFIDEVKSDFERYTRLLEEEGKIHVTPIYPPPRIDDIKIDPSIDLVLIDYLLTTLQSSGAIASYRGGTAATYISEQCPETPLVLLSTNLILGRYPNYEEEIQAIDYEISKENFD